MTSDARKTLADFLQRELDAGKLTGTAKSEREWAAKVKLAPHDVRRARAAKTALTIDKLQVFADALGVEAWQLLFPGFVRGAPEFPTMSAEALTVAQAVDQIEDDERRAKVASGIVNLLGRPPDGGHPASRPAQPAEPPVPSPETMRQPARRR